VQGYLKKLVRKFLHNISIIKYQKTKNKKSIIKPIHSNIALQT